MLETYQVRLNVFAPRKILVIDHNHDTGSLLVRSLSRKFSPAMIQLCKESNTALEAVATEQLDAVVLHRTTEQDAVSLVRAIRTLRPTLVVLAVSGMNRSESVLAAGADGFMPYDDWLSVGQFLASAAGKRGAVADGAAPAR